jgi:predicted ATPase
MFVKLQIENYRCLRSVSIDLEPLTVFVGANATGKSSAFAAMSEKFGPNDVWARASNAPITASLARDDGKVESRAWRQGHDVLLSVHFPRIRRLQLDLEVLRSHEGLQEVHELAPNGAGLANLFASLPRRSQDAVAQQLCRLVPLFQDVGTRPSTTGLHRIVFQDRWHPSLWYEPNEVSDGTILMLTYLLLGHWSPPPEVIAIEEPERGLHPYLLGQLVDTLRQLAEGKLGPQPVQILLATHSAELLEFVRPEEVRFFSRSPDTGETIVRKAPTDDPGWRTTLREYDGSLGDLWLSGGLGGVP